MPPGQLQLVSTVLLANISQTLSKQAALHVERGSSLPTMVIRHAMHVRRGKYQQTRIGFATLVSLAKEQTAIRQRALLVQQENSGTSSQTRAKLAALDTAATVATVAIFALRGKSWTLSTRTLALSAREMDASLAGPGKFLVYHIVKIVLPGGSVVKMLLVQWRA
jgi:hypothetical protein